MTADEALQSDLRRCLGAFVTGVTVMTTLGPDGRPYGMTANSFSSVSLDPPLVLWSQQTALPSYDVFAAAERFAVNILAADQAEISRRFSRPAQDKFAAVETRPGIDGLPLIEGCSAYLECRRETTYPGGDHAIFLGRVERFENQPHRMPLAFGSGRYMTVQHQDLRPFTAELAMSSVEHLDAVQLVTHAAGELAAELDVTVGLAVWGNRGATVVRWWEASTPLDIALRTGLVLPLLESATGLCFAAFLPPEAVSAHLEAEEQGPLPVELEPVLEGIRAQRLATVSSNVVPNVNERAINAVSAPVLGRGGHVVAVVTLMGHAPRFELADVGADRLAAVTAELSARLGGS